MTGAVYPGSPCRGTLFRATARGLASPEPPGDWRARDQALSGTARLGSLDNLSEGRRWKQSGDTKMSATLVRLGLAGGVVLVSCAGLGGCAAERVRVVDAGARPAALRAPFALSALSDASSPAVTLLRDRGVVAGQGGTSNLEMQVATRRRERLIGVCGGPAAKAPDQCQGWIAEPRRPAGPFAKPESYELGLRFIDRSSGRVVYAVEASLNGGRKAPRALDRRLGEAALQCAGCAGGPLVSPP